MGQRVSHLLIHHDTDGRKDHKNPNRRPNSRMGNMRCSASATLRHLPVGGGAARLLRQRLAISWPRFLSRADFDILPMLKQAPTRAIGIVAIATLLVVAMVFLMGQSRCAPTPAGPTRCVPNPATCHRMSAQQEIIAEVRHGPL